MVKCIYVVDASLR